MREDKGAFVGTKERTISRKCACFFFICLVKVIKSNAPKVRHKKKKNFKQLAVRKIKNLGMRAKQSGNSPTALEHIKECVQGAGTLWYLQKKNGFKQHLLCCVCPRGIVCRTKWQILIFITHFSLYLSLSLLCVSASLALGPWDTVSCCLKHRTQFHRHRGPFLGCTIYAQFLKWCPSG